MRQPLIARTQASIRCQRESNKFMRSATNVRASAVNRVDRVGRVVVGFKVWSGWADARRRVHLPSWDCWIREGQHDGKRRTASGDAQVHSSTASSPRVALNPKSQWKFPKFGSDLTSWSTCRRLALRDGELRRIGVQAFPVVRGAQGRSCRDHGIASLSSHLCGLHSPRSARSDRK